MLDFKDSHNKTWHKKRIKTKNLGKKHCHEALNNVTFVGVYYERKKEILTRREKIKKKTMLLRQTKLCLEACKLKPEEVYVR